MLKEELENDKNTYNEKIIKIDDILKQKKQQENFNYIDDRIQEFLNFKKPSKQILMELIKKVEVMENKQVKVYLNFNLGSEE